MQSKTDRRRFFRCDKQGIINGFRDFKRLMYRTGPSEEHNKAWASFELLMMMRCNIGQTQAVLQSIGWFIFGTMPYQLSREYMDAGKPYNKEIVDDDFYRYIKYAFIGFDLLRFLCLIISYKWIGITKYYMYIQQISLCLMHTLPQDYGDKIALLVYW